MRYFGFVWIGEMFLSLPSDDLLLQLSMPELRVILAASAALLQDCLDPVLRDPVLFRQQMTVFIDSTSHHLKVPTGQSIPVGPADVVEIVRMASDVRSRTGGLRYVPQDNGPALQASFSYFEDAWSVEAVHKLRQIYACLYLVGRSQSRD